MDGEIAPLKQICELAEKYETLTFIDESHATGIIGETGRLTLFLNIIRGTEEFCNSSNRVDIINSTLGKAIGGAGGIFPFKTKVDTQLSFELIQKDQTLLKALKENTTLFRSKIKDTKFMVLV
ncbi:hypothetical protein HZS_4626 [Henneguya salminicola]|nr:hypothetical protein HZS_4626 [Henneguya salminicola]